MSSMDVSEAVRLLYVEHHAWLSGWLRKRLGCAATAADLGHDTFVRVLVQQDRGRGIALREPRAYLTTIANGLVIDHWRRRELEQAYLAHLAQLPVAEQPSPEVRAMLLETLVAIDALLDGMAPRMRAAFLLSRLDGLGHEEIAATLGVSLSSVEKYLAKALSHCLRLKLR